MAEQKMSRWLHQVCAASVVVFASTFCAVAQGQGTPAQTGAPPTSVERGVQGVGIRAGKLEIHPEFSSRIGYDTNVFRADGKKGGQKIQDAGIFYATPGISISTIGRLRRTSGEDAAGGDNSPPKLTLRAGGFLTYFRYIGLDPVVQGINFDASVDMHILPKRPVNFEIGGSGKRSAQPFAPQAATAMTKGKNQRKSQAYDIIVPHARLNFESRGDILTGFVGYRPMIMPFEGLQYRYLSSATHDFDAGIGWKFFPSTSLLYDMTVSYIDYYKANKAPTDSSILLSNSIRVRARMGVNGAFTKQLSLRVLAGYAMGRFDEKHLDEYETPVGEAVLTYKFGGGNESQAEAGYARNISQSAVGGYIISDRGFARLKFVLARLFAMTFEGGAGRLHYGKQLSRTMDATQPDGYSYTGLGVGGSTHRVDTRVDALARAEYRVTSWLGLIAEGILMSSITNFKYQGVTKAGATASIPDPAGFTSFQVNGGLRASY